MAKELRYLFLILSIFIFILLTLKFYFSDDNKKNSYRSKKDIDKRIINYSQNIILLKNNTKESVEYIEETISKNKKNFYFWKLKTDNEK
tara:strand:+ start:134 stop:400 length:267 start_codon:yes stop_codon:yes gene_type:complete